MTLSAGTRLGPYEILAPIGAGGMGEVYRARDTRLDRTVAIKVLPERSAPTPETRQRFEREARTVSQLQHPHICALHDVGREGETEYLVMEYLEGETLTDRLRHGALPLEQALRYGTQIADALDRAHRQGIVHRDLKPANVMITKSGVKLLDFGLAKVAPVPAAQGSLTALPTQQGLTQEGTILGTFQYMAPEQLEAKEADARTDIFALGAVLYEMTTGRKAFSGSSQASLISAIMKEEPSPISTVQPMSPPALDRVVRTCLAKDPEDRWQSAHDVAGELKWIAEGSQAGAPAAVVSHRRNRERLAWSLAAAALVAAALFGWGWVRRAPRPAELIRAALPLPAGTFISEVVVSPDGRKIALTVTTLDGKPGLWIRDLDADAPRRVVNADNVYFPFWSPDSRKVGYFADGKLQVVSVPDGVIHVLCDARQGVGGSWNRDGTIVFAPTGTSPLFRVSASGGAPVAVTKLDASRHEVAHRYPSFLPDGRRFLYLATDLGSTGEHAHSGIRLGSLDGTLDRELVSTVSNGQYVAGQLLYVRDATLVAQAVDLDVGAVRGEAVTVAPLLDRASDWTGYYTYSASESLLMVSQVDAPQSRLALFDRTGRPLGGFGSPGHFLNPRFSPDGRRIAVELSNVARDTSEIWVFEAATGAGTRVVQGPFRNTEPTWSPDGVRLFFASDRAKRNTRGDVWVRAMDGGGETAFYQAEDQNTPLDWSRDGRYLAVSRIPLRERNYQIWVVDTAAPGHPLIPVSTDSSDHHEARFSPDGKWIVYQSDESGSMEIYVRPFPGPGSATRISRAGGLSPRWRRGEIFYLAADKKITAVTVETQPTLRVGAPMALFGKSFNGWDISEDGQQFLLSALPDDTGTPPLTMLLNWTKLLHPIEPAR